MMSIDQIIGRNIRARRKGLGLSQAVLGKQLGISYQQLQKYETGVNGISCAKMLRLAAFFQCSLDDLCKGAFEEAMEIAAPLPPVDTYRTAFLVDQFQHIPSHKLRDMLCKLVQSLAATHTTDGGMPQ